MPLLLVLPSLLVSVLFALSSGYWSAMGYAAAAALGQLMIFLIQKRRTSQPEQASMRVEQAAGWVHSKKLPDRTTWWTKRQKSMFAQTWNRQFSNFRAQTLAGFYATPAADLPRLGLTLSGGKPVELDWHANPHALIVGPTGSGKSALLSRLISELSENRLQPSLWFFDFKYGQTLVDCQLQLQHFDKARLQLFSNLDQQNLESGLASLAGELHREDSSRTKIVVIEELAEALSDLKTATAIVKLAAQGRASGIRLICTNQSVSGIPRTLLVNLANRIALQGTDSTDLLLLDSGHRATSATAIEPSIAVSGNAKVVATEARVFVADFVNHKVRFEFLPVWSAAGS